MSVCEHKNVITDEIEGIVQTICSDCGEVFNYDIGLVGGDEFNEETNTRIGKLCPDEYLPPIAMKSKSNNSSESVYRFWKIRKAKKDTRNMLNTLKISFDENIITNISSFYIKVRTFAPNHKGKKAVLLESVRYVLEDSSLLPSIQLLSNIFSIPIHDLTRAKRVVKDYLQENGLLTSNQKNNFSEPILLTFRSINDYECFFKDEELDEGLEMTHSLYKIFEKCECLPKSDPISTIKVILIISRMALNEEKEIPLPQRNYLRKMNPIELSRRHHFNRILKSIALRLPWIPKKLNAKLLYSSIKDIFSFVTKTQASQLKSIITPPKRSYKNRLKYIERIRKEVNTNKMNQNTNLHDFEEDEGKFQSEKDAIVFYIKKGLKDEDIANIDTNEMYHESFAKKIPLITDEDIDRDADTYMKSILEQKLSQDYFNLDKK